MAEPTQAPSVPQGGRPSPTPPGGRCLAPRIYTPQPPSRPPPPPRAAGAVLRSSFIVSLGTAPKDSPWEHPTANRHQPPPTANQPPPTANQPPPTVTNRHQPPTNRQPPTATNRQPTATNRQPTATNRQPTVTNRHQPPTNRHQPPPTATNRQPPTATNRHQPPTIVQHCFCGSVSCPCLDHEAESVPVNVRVCWRHEPFAVLLSPKDGPAGGPSRWQGRPGTAAGAPLPTRRQSVCQSPGAHPPTAAVRTAAALHSGGGRHCPSDGRAGGAGRGSAAPGPGPGDGLPAVLRPFRRRGCHISEAPAPPPVHAVAPPPPRPYSALPQPKGRAPHIVRAAPPHKARGQVLQTGGGGFSRPPLPPTGDGALPSGHSGTDIGTKTQRNTENGLFGISASRGGGVRKKEHPLPFFDEKNCKPFLPKIKALTEEPPPLPPGVVRAHTTPSPPPPSTRPVRLDLGGAGLMEQGRMPQGPCTTTPSSTVRGYQGGGGHQG